MSVIVVPLAGPDLLSNNGVIKPLLDFHNTSLINYVLSKRFWMSGNCTSTLIFVLRDIGSQTEEIKIHLRSKFPSSKVIVISDLTQGALFSALCGIALISDFNQPVIVDLADIAFDFTFDSKTYFDKYPLVDAVLPYFDSQNSNLSYIELDGIEVRRLREKSVISSNASAGVYIFRNVSAYLEAVAFAINNQNICTINGNFFVCPSLNVFIAKGKKVHALSVDAVEPLTLLFH